MKKSESIAALSAALAKAQAVLKNPSFDSVNPHFKSKFASLGAVRAEVIPAFAAQEISLSQWPVSADGRAGCITHLAHSSGEWMEEEFLIPVDKHNAHGYASAVTYSKRISMMSVAGVVGDVDDDANGAVGENVKGERQANGIIKGPTITPTEGAWDALDKDEQAFLRGLADETRTMFVETGAQAAWDHLEKARLLQEEMLAMWPLLPSNVRSAFKKIGPFTQHFQKEAA
jgi:hypothetical protein